MAIPHLSHLFRSVFLFSLLALGMHSLQLFADDGIALDSPLPQALLKRYLYRPFPAERIYEMGVQSPEMRVQADQIQSQVTNYIDNYRREEKLRQNMRERGVYQIENGILTLDLIPKFTEFDESTFNTLLHHPENRDEAEEANLTVEKLIRIRNLVANLQPQARVGLEEMIAKTQARKEADRLSGIRGVTYEDPFVNLMISAEKMNVDNRATELQNAEGRILMTPIDDIPIYKVLLSGEDKTQEYLIVDTRYISPQSTHLRQYIARQLTRAGGEGRHTTLLFYRSNRSGEGLINIYHVPLAETMLGKLNDSRIAAIKHPDLKRVVFGVFYAGFIYSLSLAAMKLLQNSGAYHGSGSNAPLFVNMIMSLAIGIYHPTYRYIIYEFGTPLQKSIKHIALVSFWGAYFSKAFEFGFDSLNPTTGVGLAAISYLIFNSIATNIARPYFYAIVNARSRLEVNRGNLRWAPFIQRKAFEMEFFVYSILFTIKFLHLFKYTVHGVHVGEYGIWIGTLAAFAISYAHFKTGLAPSWKFPFLKKVDYEYQKKDFDELFSDIRKVRFLLKDIPLSFIDSLADPKGTVLRAAESATQDIANLGDAMQAWSEKRKLVLWTVNGPARACGAALSELGRKLQDRVDTPMRNHFDSLPLSALTP